MREGGFGREGLNPKGHRQVCRLNRHCGDVSYPYAEAFPSSGLWQYIPSYNRPFGYFRPLQSHRFGAVQESLVHDLWPVTMKNLEWVGGSITMSNPMEIAPDIAILLAKTWQQQQNQPIDKEVVCRIWAFDLGWFDMVTASRVRDNLLQSGWIDATSEGFTPAIDIEAIEVPFGWLPTMRLLESPPNLPKGMKPVPEQKQEVVVEPVRKSTETASVDPASAHITPLLEQISAASGLEKKEVLRRAQRKRRALGPVTLWMALLLVAREQKLAMSPFIQTISP